MTAELSMNQIIHAAVLRDVARTEQALRTLPLGDGERARNIQRAWAHLAGQVTEHHEQEDALVWPYLRSQGIDSSLLDAMESEHQGLSTALLAGSDALGRAVAEPSSAVEAAGVVAESGAVIARHFEHEERDVEPLLKARSEDPGWKAVEKKFRAGGLTRAGNMMAWLQDGGTAEAQSALRQTIPPPVLMVLSKVFGRGYHKNVAPVWRA